MVQNSLLRANAYKQLGGSIFQSKWLMMTLVCALLPFAEAAAVSLYIFGIIAVIIISGPLHYGIARTTLECVENEKWDVSHAFVAFQENFGHSAMLGFLQGLLTFLWSLLLIVPGIVKSSRAIAVPLPRPTTPSFIIFSLIIISPFYWDFSK